MPLHLFAWNEHSEGARELAQALGIRRIRRERSTYVGGPNKRVINWGSSQIPENVSRSVVLNSPTAVGAMSNKRTFFEMLNASDVRLPDWTTDFNVASRWLDDDENTKVVARHRLTGHSGEGITIYENRRHFLLDNARAPLYTKYVPKKLEYRVHFAFGQIIDVQRKIRDPDRDVLDWKVRSHQNGFIYVRNGVRDTMPRDVLDQASAAMGEMGLDFGAIDIIYNSSRNHAYVLEVNTAPGLTGETVNSYANAFRQFV